MSDDTATSDHQIAVTVITEPTPRLGWGYRPSPIDETTPRHTPIFGLVPTPDDFSLPRFEQIPVRDQGSRSTCVAQATRTIREYLALLGGTQCRLSMEYLYDRAQAVDPNPGLGTCPALVLQLLRNEGTPHEASLPDAPQDNEVNPTTLARLAIEASAFKVQSVGIVETIAAAQATMLQQHALLAGIFLSANQERQITATGQLPIPQPEDVVIGGHAIVLYGWVMIANQLYFRFRNSWGSQWGTNGNGLIPADYPHLFADVWAVSI